MNTAKPSPTNGAVNSTEPIRAELFSVERLERYAEELAAAQIISTKAAGRPLLPRVLEDGRILHRCYREIAEAVEREHAITPAAEWLVDNFYVVDEQLRQIATDLPPRYYRVLPKLASGDFQGYPRVFGVAWEFIAHTDSRFDGNALRSFVRAYQRVQPLTIGELWAIAITLRIVLVENLRRLAERIVQSRAARHEADLLADQLLDRPDSEQVDLQGILRGYEKPDLPSAFAVQLVQRLRDLDPKVAPVLAWLDRRLAEQGTTADEMIRLEHQQQSAGTITVRNVITSMRSITAFDWRVFFESVSPVDEVLRKDTNFGELDFNTRDSYRRAIEDLSRRSDHSEIEIARKLAEKSRRLSSAQPGTSSDGRLSEEERTTDPGYSLVSKGRYAFERELGYRVSWRRRVVRRYVRTALPDYLGTIFLTTALILLLPLYYTHRLGVATYVLVVLGILGAIPASDLAIALVNRVATETLGPRKLPRFALREGVPPEMRTILVMPVLLTSQVEIERHLENLEVHYLANADGEIYFALLSDWADAPEEQLSGDEDLRADAAAGIARLNEKYPLPGGQRFFLFHRKRMWNEREGKWIGWERKRGKLQELNRLLRGATDTTFVAIGGKAPTAPENVRYVVTVDADTRLSRNTARQLIGMIAHPLNRARFDPERGRVVEGYGILQPRVTPTLPEDREGSLFQRVYSGPGGIDPYSGAVSDVYQDLFHEGSFTGKGIYDVDAFEAAMAGKVPENAILSHDLFEGIFARTALASDIEFFEEFPPYYDVAASRHHRWARGDWQLLPCIFHRFRAPIGSSAQTNSGEPVAKPSRGATIPALGRWKLLDNLRRSLSAPATLLTLVLGWLLAPQKPLLWTEFVLATIAIPPLIPTVSELMLRNRGNSLRVHFRRVLDDFVLALWQIGLTITFLAHQAWLMSDAILRTLGRLFLTHRNLLEWTTAAQAKRRRRSELAGVYGLMYGSVVLAVVTAAAAIVMHRNVWFVAGPFLALWLAAPAVALWTSQPQQHAAEQAAKPEDKRAIRLTARRTWRFFETFVTEDTHFLPPDGFQEDPVPVVAHRTSPTNIGLYLLSTVSAYDFGWLGLLDTVGRLEATFATIRQMESYRGHLYNWYDTASLRPLEPRYISSVDSGNLAGHLLALANACREFLNKPFAGPGFFLGVEDAVRLAGEAYAAAPKLKHKDAAAATRYRDALDAFSSALDLPAGNAEGLTSRLARLNAAALELSDSARAFKSGGEELSHEDLILWADAARACVDSHSRDAEIFVPMLRLQEQALARTKAIAVNDPLARRKDDLPHVALPRIEDAAEHFGQLLLELKESPGPDRSSSNPDKATESEAMRHAAQQAAAAAAALANRIATLAQAAEDLFYGQDFSFLYEPTRRLLSIGYRVGDQILDTDCYDLLASEARLASFIGIAKGELPAAHWFRLSRAVTSVGRGAVLISWSGSMFEYLMPALVMHSPANSLLRQTCELSVRRQIEYGDERGVPWGISESAYNERDLHLTYQYSGFGVPGLGLKRGLADDLVVAPYATALAAMFEPATAIRNLRRIAVAGGLGVYGFYESLDYTRTRVPEGQDHAVVRAYFAHHQGMSIVAFGNVVTGGAMRARFHAEPIVKATELLLQERPPREIRAAQPNEEEVASVVHVRELTPPVTRQFSSPHDSPPRTHLLSNGRYSVMLTAAGSGYSRWQNVAISRWREDSTLDSWGSYIYFRDVRSGRVWSAGYQPVGAEPDFYQACFYEDRAEIIRRDGAINTKLEVAISPEDDAELRRISLTNHGGATREIEVTSFLELVLAPQAADQAHPAFSNLFVQTEFVAPAGTLLATRRKRSADESPVWLAHLAVAEGEAER